MDKVLLFGGSGLVGTELRRRWKPGWGELAVAPRSVDITDADGVQKILTQEKPVFVVNCAALSGVDICETDPLKAYEVNGHGPEVLASACKSADVVLVHLSTDYVFPTSSDGQPFTEQSFPDPVNEYGRSKLEGEKRVAHWPKHYILRTSSLYGMGRSTHAAWVLGAIETGKPVKIAEDIWGSPTYIGDLADWIGQLILIKPSFGTYHLCPEGFCSRFQFAQKMCELRKAKKPYPIEKVSWRALALPAPRPDRPLLSKEKWAKAVEPLPTWEEGLKRYLAEACSR